MAFGRARRQAGGDRLTPAPGICAPPDLAMVKKPGRPGPPRPGARRSRRLSVPAGPVGRTGPRLRRRGGDCRGRRLAASAKPVAKGPSPEGPGLAAVATRPGPVDADARGGTRWLHKYQEGACFFYCSFSSREV
jgi:hypothetical protein